MSEQNFKWYMLPLYALGMIIIALVAAMQGLFDLINEAIGLDK
jgi:hypothetical protein